MSWKIEPENERSIFESETWYLEGEQVILQASRFVDYLTGYVIVKARPKISPKNPAGFDVCNLDDVDDYYVVSREWWEWPAGLDDATIEGLENLIRVNGALILASLGWKRISCSRVFFGPLMLSRCE